MFQAPSASRGKTNKGRAQDAEQAKKSLQRGTKAQRKAGGLQRGAHFDVEAVGCMYGQDGDQISVAPKPEPAESEESSDSAEELEEEKASTPLPATPPLALSSESAADVDDEDEEVAAIKEELRQQLHDLANDPGMPLDEQKRAVRQLMAQWHPDKNRHMLTAATSIFQFIQSEVDRIVASFSAAASAASKKVDERKERQAQRSAEKSATASALQSARAEKSKKKKKGRPDEDAEHGDDLSKPVDDAADCNEGVKEEFSLVIGHGPATTAHLRPWPRSHLTLTCSPLDTAQGDMFFFGGEAYDGRELTFYSDLYRLNLHSAEPGTVLPWEKLYSSVPLIPGPEARSSHQAVTWDRFLFVFGGEWSSRDQNRYRQFSDLWRFDTSGGPGTRWERLDAGEGPAARSGHRMAIDSSTKDGHAVLFGGFSEDKKRRATYLDDLHILHLPTTSWRSASSKSSGARSRKPFARAGGLLWVSQGATYVYGGNRALKRKKGGDGLQILVDLWRATLDTTSASEFTVRWEPLEVQGLGPGPRSGLSQCAVSSSSPGRRIVFGGVLDMTVAANEEKGTRKREVALFHNDVFLLDCEASSPAWSRLWPPPGSGFAPVLTPAALPAELLEKGGGADVQTLVAMPAASTGEEHPAAATAAPRGRIAAGCVVFKGSLWVFGGSCESGPRQEVTLDDLWRLPVDVMNGLEESQEPQEWECILALSERATMWFDSSDSEDDEDDEEEHDAGNRLATIDERGGGVLSKKGQKQAAHTARMEAKQQRNEERNEEKTDKRELKKERQRQQAREKATKN